MPESTKLQKRTRNAIYRTVLGLEKSLFDYNRIMVTAKNANDQALIAYIEPIMENLFQNLSYLSVKYSFIKPNYDHSKLDYTRPHMQNFINSCGLSHFGRLNELICSDSVMKPLANELKDTSEQCKQHLNNLDSITKDYRLLAHMDLSELARNLEEAARIHDFNLNPFIE